VKLWGVKNVSGGLQHTSVNKGGAVCAGSERSSVNKGGAVCSLVAATLQCFTKLGAVCSLVAELPRTLCLFV